MYSETTGTNPLEAKNEFALEELTGLWKSREGAPDIRVYNDSERKNGCFFMEFAFKTGELFRCPVKKHQGIRYVNLYGVMSLSYNTESDVLQLSVYGKYYRVED